MFFVIRKAVFEFFERNFEGIKLQIKRVKLLLNSLIEGSLLIFVLLVFQQVVTVVLLILIFVDGNVFILIQRFYRFFGWLLDNFLALFVGNQIKNRGPFG